MGREKGHVKVGGRTKGTPNKTTKEMQLMCIDLFNSNFADLSHALQELKKEDPKLFIDAMMKLASYCVSKPTIENDVTSNGESVSPVSIIVDR